MLIATKKMAWYSFNEELYVPDIKYLCSVFMCGQS